MLDNAEVPEADFGVDVIQNRESVPLCWERVGKGDDMVPIAVLEPDVYSLRLTNNGDEKVVARVGIDGQAMKCLYYLAPRSTHTVKGRRVSEDEVLPLHFQMVGRSVKLLRGLTVEGLLDHLGSIEVEFYKAVETKEPRIQWKSSKTQSVLRAWPNDTQSTVALHSSTAYGSPCPFPSKTGYTLQPRKRWRIADPQPLAVATVYLLDIDTAVALGLVPTSPAYQSPPLSPSALQEALKEARAEATRWKDKFEQLVLWVDAHISTKRSTPRNPPLTKPPYTPIPYLRGRPEAPRASPKRPVLRPMKFSLSPTAVSRGPLTSRSPSAPISSASYSF